MTRLKLLITALILTFGLGACAGDEPQFGRNGKKSSPRIAKQNASKNRATTSKSRYKSGRKSLAGHRTKRKARLSTKKTGAWKKTKYSRGKAPGKKKPQTARYRKSGRRS